VITHDRGASAEDAAGPCGAGHTGRRLAELLVSAGVHLIANPASTNIWSGGISSDSHHSRFVAARTNSPAISQLESLFPEEIRHHRGIGVAGVIQAREAECCLEGTQ